MEQSDALQYLLDRTEIIDVTLRYASSIDAKKWDDFKSCFTDTIELNLIATGGWVQAPIDTFIGSASEFYANLDATQHVSANHQVKISGDAATCRSTLNATHYLASAAGGAIQRQMGYYDYELTRTSLGWKICRFRQDAMWEDGNQAIIDHAMRNIAVPEALPTS